MIYDSQKQKSKTGWGYIIDSITSLKSERTQTEKREPILSNEFSYSDNSSVSQKDIIIIPNINFIKDDEIINNEIFTNEKRKNIIKTNLRKK